MIVEEIADTIVELKKRGLSILLSEQNVGFAEIVSDRAYMLEKGQIRWAGTMAELVEDAENSAQLSDAVIQSTLWAARATRRGCATGPRECSRMNCVVTRVADEDRAESSR